MAVNIVDLYMVMIKQQLLKHIYVFNIKEEKEEIMAKYIIPLSDSTWAPRLGQGGNHG